MTEEQYKKLLNRFEKLVAESIQLEGVEEAKNKGIDAAKSGVLNYMRQMANDGTRFQDTASELGLNPTGFNRGEKEYQKTYKKGFDAEMDKGIQSTYNPDTKQVTNTVNPEMSEEILAAAERIKKYVNQNKYGATIRWEEFKKDPDYVYLMRMKDLIDRKGLTNLYDENAPLPSDQGYGLKDGDSSEFDYTGFQVNSNGKIGKNYSSVIDFWTSRVRNFVESKYGFDIAIPQEAFSAGNKKLPNNTLIINFSSAMRCPAWNECLVKHACYARAGEKPHTAVYRANTNRYLLWELTRGDEKMMSLMLNMVKAYMFNYEAIFNAAHSLLKKQNIKNINELLAVDLEDELITDVLFDYFTKFRNIENVRLNEDGDFLGQWLVDAWNEFGGKVKKFGITISAYTCRNLNFEGVKNIVLNSSNTSNKSVDRYFIAISEEAYKAFDDTHEGFDPQTGRLKTVLRPLGTFDDTGRWTPNGNYYYKCPCGNEDVMGPDKKKSEKTKLSDYDCYKCNTCYTPNDINGGQPYYVFVKVHGTTESYLQERDGGSFRFGFSEHYQQNMEANKSIQQVKPKKKGLKEDLEAETMGPQSDDLALMQVTNNMVGSMNNHFSSYNPVMEESKVKTEFNEVLNKLNNVEF